MSKGFAREFEDAQTLTGLLELSGSPVPVEEVVERMREAQASGDDSSDFIPTLFEGEPRFPDPEVARRLFQNLLGLWDLVQSGQKVRLSGPPPKKVKKAPSPAPPPYAPGEPDEVYVDSAWKHLTDLDARGMQRLLHSFENRQDALLGWLDDSGLSDDGYAVARHLLFELTALIELGWPSGLRNVMSADLSGQGVTAPEALREYAEEAIFEAEQDDEAPLSPDEAAKVRERVNTGLGALWKARRG